MLRIHMRKSIHICSVLPLLQQRQMLQLPAQHRYKSVLPPLSRRFVVMVLGKPATNTFSLTNQQTGTLLPGGSVDVSFAFHATSVGRWSQDLAVRNLSNKHDQVSKQGKKPSRERFFFSKAQPDRRGSCEPLSRRSVCSSARVMAPGVLSMSDNPKTRMNRRRYAIHHGGGAVCKTNHRCQVVMQRYCRSTPPLQPTTNCSAYPPLASVGIG